MFRVTIAILILGGCLTGYRLIGQMLPIITHLPAALTQPGVEAPISEAVPLVANGATPTVAALFLAQPSKAASPTAKGQGVPITLQPTPQTNNQATTAATQAQAAVYPAVVIYDDQLNASWSVEQSANSAINLAATDLNFQSLDRQQAHSSGATSIAITPQADYGTLFFTVRPESGAVYQRQSVLGVSFWLNSGSSGIGPADLAIAVVGSNVFAYWTPDDQSVFPDKKGAFSETRLYFLKINRTIPPHTWLNLVVWLNDLQYDPVYQYVTGFYLKNDVGFRSTYYLDQVALLMAP